MKSIMHSKEARTCYLCIMLHGDYQARENLEEHHVYYGNGLRALSEKYGLKVYLCHEHHQSSPESVHNNPNHKYALTLQKEGQRTFNTKYPDKDFVRIFGRNYL